MGNCYTGYILEPIFRADTGFTLLKELSDEEIVYG